MSKELKAWECDECERAYLSKELADKCCEVKPENKCRLCGCNVKHPYLICKDCREKERYEKATKVKYSDYNIGCLYDENKEQYYFDAEDLEEAYYNDAFDYGKEQPEYPKWCYGCTEELFQVDIESAIEREAEEMYEDFDTDNSLVDLKELLDFVEEWNKKQIEKTYYVDYKTVVLLNE